MNLDANTLIFLTNIVVFLVARRIAKIEERLDVVETCQKSIQVEQ